MPNQDPQHLLVRVARILNELKIPYLISGGIAVLVWGRPRFTANIDIVIELKQSDIPKLETALRQLRHHGYVDKDMMREALKYQGEFNFIDGETGIKVDFWMLTDSVFDRSRLKRRQVKKILGENVYFTAPEDLILIKLKWHKESESHRQLEDIESILKITSKIDKKYLRMMAKLMDLTGLLEKTLLKN